VHKTLPELVALWQKPRGAVPPNEERPELHHPLQWFREIEQASEQLKLIRRFQNNEPGVADLLVRIYYPLIKRFAGYSARPSQRDWMDLTQEAVVALWFACVRWDFTREITSPYSYIYSYIKSYTRRYRMTELEVVRHPVHLYEGGAASRQGYDKIPFNRARSILFSDLGEAHGLRSEASETSFQDMLVDERELAEETLSDEELRAKLPEVVIELSRGLAPRDIDMIVRRYGETERTLEELGQECGVTRERVRQIEVKVFAHFLERARALKCRREKFRTFEEWATALVRAVQTQKSEAELLVISEAARQKALFASVDRAVMKLREEKALKVHSAVESILAQTKLVRIQSRTASASSHLSAQSRLAAHAESFEARLAARKVVTRGRSSRFKEALAKTRRAISESRRCEAPEEAQKKEEDDWFPYG
jgi:RNA polymerase sigma factor (sigma-70 family)